MRVGAGTRRFRLFLVILSAAVAPAALSAPRNPVVTVTSGKIEGTRVGRVSVFKGIPFAEPPTGNRRWQPPAPKAAWAGTRAATSFPPPCPQLEIKSGAPQGNEDCLYLNVWAPELDTSSERLPVMVFIHGGGSATGSTTDTLGVESELLYEATELAREGRVVVVTIQYRLGMLGLLALPGLRDEQATGTTGNYASLDKILALQWVKANAAAFGGDSARTTIFGESAGGYSVCDLIASPLASGLFSGAIMQSGACSAKTLAASFGEGAELARGVGCDGLTSAEAVACLRGVPVNTLLHEQPSIRPRFLGNQTYGSTIDGYFLTSDPSTVIAAGNHNRVPVLLGSNTHEARFFLLGGNVTAVQSLAALAPALGAEAYDRLLSYYPASEYGGSSERAAVIALSDLGLTCPIQDAALKLQQSSEPVYGYYYTHAVDGTAKISATVNARATLSTTITISGPLGQYKKQIPFTRTLSGSQTYSLSKPLREIEPLHGFELPFVFQRWSVWERSLNKLADAALRGNLAPLRSHAEDQADAKLQAQLALIPSIVQQRIDQAVAAFRAEHPFLGWLLKIENTPVKVSGASVTVTSSEVDLEFDRDEEQVQRAFLRYWTNFAHSGNPSTDWSPKLAKNASAWPALNASTLTYLGIDETQKVLPDFKREVCGFVNALEVNR